MGTCSHDFTLHVLSLKKQTSKKKKTLYITLMTNTAQYKIIIKTMKIMLKAVVVCGKEWECIVFHRQLFEQLSLHYLKLCYSFITFKFNWLFIVIYYMLGGWVCLILLQTSSEEPTFWSISIGVDSSSVYRKLEWIKKMSVFFSIWKGLYIFHDITEVTADIFFFTKR